MTVAPVEEESLPRRFGGYLLFDKIGEGGMARIYLSRRRTGLGAERVIVVKEILPILADSQEFCQLLIDEAKLSATLSHRNIVQVIDLGREGNTLYIAMEYVEGLDLRDLLRYCSKNKVPLPVEYCLFIVAETLRALEYAHRKKDDEGNPMFIVHRDVSPSNVLISVDGEVKLCDFGIARATSTKGDVLPEEAIQGKAGYMSPEAALGEAVDQRSDLFSAGIIAWELLSGRRLYKSGPEHLPLLTQARMAEVPSLVERGYPEEERLHAIVLRALARDPNERYQTAQDMLRELEAYMGEHRMVASPVRFGDWLHEHFEETIVARRRAREYAAKVLDEEPVESHPRPRQRQEDNVPTLAPPPSATAAPPPSVPVNLVPQAAPQNAGPPVPLLWLVIAALLGGLLALFVFR